MARQRNAKRTDAAPSNATDNPYISDKARRAFLRAVHGETTGLGKYLSTEEAVAAWRAGRPVQIPPGWTTYTSTCVECGAGTIAINPDRTQGMCPVCGATETYTHGNVQSIVREVVDDGDLPF